MARRAAALAILVVLVAALLAPAGAAPGVSRTVIKIGLHAPLTGAAPVPSSSVEKGKDLYFRWLESKGRSINGRDVRVILKNDQYNPSTAVAVCKEMVEKEHVFMIFGVGGADQIQACARYAASVGVPYVSPGTTTTVLKDLDNYFATSMTWKGQARLLADYFVATADARSRENGAVSFDTPSHTQATDAFAARLVDRNAVLHYDRRVSRGAGGAEARTVVAEMDLAGIDNVFMLVSPVWFIQVIAQANDQGFTPRWMGIDNGIAKNTVTSAGCRSGNALDGARFFSPYPAVMDSDRFDPDFRKAVAELEPSSTPDDFMWELWALDRVIAKMLALPGRELTRSRFISKVERADRIRTGIGPTLRYSPTDHFGAASTHVLKADCSRNRWVTGATFKRDF